MSIGLGLGSFAGGLLGGLGTGSMLKQAFGKTPAGGLIDTEKPLSNTIAGAAGVNAAVGSGALIGNNSAGGVQAMLDDGGNTAGGVGGMTSGLPVLGASLLGDNTGDSKKTTGNWTFISNLLNGGE